MHRERSPTLVARKSSADSSLTRPTPDVEGYRERKLVLNRQHKRKNGVAVGGERVPTILVRKSSAKPIKTVITYTIITLLCQNTCKKARVSRVPERNPYLALQEHVKLVSAERVAASVVSGPVKNCSRLHAQLPVYNKGQKSVEINALLTNTYVYMTNSATHTRPELAKTDGYAVKIKQRCLLCSGIYGWCYFYFTKAPFAKAPCAKAPFAKVHGRCY